MNLSFFRSLTGLVYDNRMIFLLLSTLIAFLILDTLLIKIYPFNTIEPVFGPRLSIFVIIGSMFAIGQYLILKYIRKKSAKIRSKEKHFDRIHEVVVVTQVVITAILLVVILQMITMSRYNNGMIIACATMSYILSMLLMTILSKRFFSWSKSNRNIVVISYAISSTIIALNAGITIVLVDIILSQQPSEARPHSGPVSPTVSLFFATFSLIGTLNYAFVATTVASFVSFWLSTALLLRHYSERLGQAKYWVMLSIPLVFFLSQFMPLFAELFSTMRQSEPVLFSMFYTTIFTLSTPAGGILFGIAFWMVARSLPRHNVVRDYLIISAFGIVLLFTSNQAMILVSFSYPPFGLVTISFLGISSYLILVGIYSSAISVSQDISLRRSVKNQAFQEAKLLDSIGTAQMEQEIEERAILLTRRCQDMMVEETGISTSLNAEDIKKYLKEVIEEVKKQRTER